MPKKSSPNKKESVRIKNISLHWLHQRLVHYRHVLIAALLFFVVTVSFLWPMATNLSTYSEGGDHMFNAWTLARNHHCLLLQDCSSYSDGNIFFPNKDSMLYSETQLSAGLLTLPLHFVNDNPLFSVNVWYVLSAFFSGFFMYLLAHYLSGGRKIFSILAGLVFEFAPNKISSMSHLQNLSIFYVPLIILMLLKFKATGEKKYLAGFGIASLLLFFASWYQMVFGLVIVVLFIGYTMLNSEHRRRGLLLLATTLFALACTLPLALEYSRFSKSKNANFSIASQVEFSASVNDYVLPYQESPFGSLYYQIHQNSKRNSYNPDSFSYAGITLYSILVFCVGAALFSSKSFFVKNKQLCVLLGIVAVTGIVLSLGPIVKYGSHSSFAINGVRLAIPAPYILVDLFIPQLSFIRAIGRAAVIPLFALCCLLAIFAGYLMNESKLKSKQKMFFGSLIVLIVSFDLLPIQTLLTRPFKQIDTNQVQYTIPQVYKFINANRDVNNIVIVRTQKDYPYAGIPVAQTEDTLWAGYHNRNIFNGYSGYEPADYKEQLQDFTDLDHDDKDKMHQLGLQYYLIHEELSQNSGLVNKANEVFGKPIFKDSKYSLYKI